MSIKIDRSWVWECFLSATLYLWIFTMGFVAFLLAWPLESPLKMFLGAVGLTFMAYVVSRLTIFRYGPNIIGD